MGRSFVKQPDGNFAVWSSVVDDFIYENKTQEELIETLAKEAYDDEKVRLGRVFEDLEAPLARMSFKSYDECTKTKRWRKRIQERVAAGLEVGDEDDED